MKSVNYGLSLTSVLLVVFITLKVTGNLDWSWIAVILVPFAIELAVIVVLILITAVFAGIYYWLKNKEIK